MWCCDGLPKRPSAPPVTETVHRLAPHNCLLGRSLAVSAGRRLPQTAGDLVVVGDDGGDGGKVDGYVNSFSPSRNSGLFLLRLQSY